MSWIEGVGDEVTVTVGVLIISTLIFVAWASTGIRDIPIISVIIVHLTTRRNRRQGQGQTEPQGQGQSQEHVVQRETSSRQIRGQGTIGSPLYVNITVREREARHETSQQGEETSNTESTAENNGAVETIPVQPSADSQIKHSSTDTAIAAGSSQTSDVIEDSIGTESASSVTKETSVDGRDEIKAGASGGSELEKSSPDERHTGSQSNIESVEPQPVTSETLSETELRNRRVAFFNVKKNISSSESEEGSSVDNNKVKERGQSSLTEEVVIPKSSESQESCNSEATEGQTEQRTDTHTEETVVNQSVTGSRLQVEDPQVRLDGEIRVRLKYLNDTQRLVTALPTETIGTFRRNHFSMELSESKLVRFIFNGQDLRNDGSTLQACNISDNSVVHCLITQPRQQPNTHNNNTESPGLDIGNYLFPVFGIFLGMIWYLRFTYKQFFSVSSTLMLASITVLFLALFVSMFRRNRVNIEVPE